MKVAVITIFAVAVALVASLARGDTCRSVVSGKCSGPDACMWAEDSCGNSSSASVGGGMCRWAYRDECPGSSSCRMTSDYSCSRWPLFKQCGESWSGDTMGSNGDTICQVGCLMSSISMALNAHNVSIAGRAATPGTLNAWLRANGGYVPGSSALYDAVVDKISPTRVRFTGIHKGHAFSLGQIDQTLNDPSKVVIANVMSGQHFVLVTGVDKERNELFVNDPGFSRWSYPYDGTVVGFNTFTMNG